MLQSMAAAAERVFEFLNEPEEDQTADPARRADPACIDGSGHALQHVGHLRQLLDGRCV